MDTPTPDFSKLSASEALAWAQKAIESGDHDQRPRWNEIPTPFPWALLGLAKRKNEQSSSNDDFSGETLEGLEARVIETLHAFLDKGGVFLDSQTQAELLSGNSDLLRTPYDPYSSYLDPMERWEKIKGVAPHTQPPGPTPHINLLLLNDVRLVQAWMEEAMAFEETQHKGRGTLLLLDLARGLIRLGKENKRQGWRVAVEKIQEIHGDDWPTCDLGAGTPAGTLAGELITSWDVGRSSWLFERYDLAATRCAAHRKGFSLGNLAVREQSKLLDHHLRWTADKSHDQWNDYIYRLSQILQHHTAYSLSTGQWTRNRFGGLDVSADDYDVLELFVGSLFRKTGDQEKIIDILEVVEATCGLDVSGPQPTSIHDDDQRLLPAGWEHTLLAAAWKRRKLLRFTSDSTEGAPSGAPKMKM